MKAIATLFFTSAYALLLARPGLAADSEAAHLEHFEKKVRPVFLNQCVGCHSQSAEQVNKLKGGLKLDTVAGIQQGGSRGKLFVPGKPAESLLVQALKQTGALKMPPKGQLPDAVLADIEKWITNGATLPKDEAKPNVAQASGADIDWQKAKTYWAFQPVTNPAKPTVQTPNWGKKDLDAFILAELEKKKLKPVAPADKATLLRRTTFDLLGLPPTPEELADFLADDSPNAFAKVVDRLLQSPHYGERWGRHWLDVARYAEDQAHTFGVKPNGQAYRYRDWVVAALNEDMPIDKFFKLQLAADQLLTDDAERVKHLPALGFLGLGAQYYKDNSEILKALADELDERVDTVSRGLLGLTVACARCHDHKFDPISTHDYYALAGIFQSTKLADVPLASKEQIAQYQERVKQTKDLDDKLKQFLATEKSVVQQEQAKTITQYVQALANLQEKRKTSPQFTPREQAKAAGLDAGTLDRWNKFFDGNVKEGRVESCKQVLKAITTPKPEQVTQAAQALQEHVQQILADRAKGSLDKEKTALVQALFGDKGVYVASDDEVKAKLLGERKQQFEQMQRTLTELRKDAPEKLEAKFPVAHVVADGTVADMKVYLRGNPRTQGDLVPRRFLRVLTDDPQAKFSKGSGRLELAEAIVHPQNPLTARVFVNRVWQWHFGRGLVPTPSNFGSLGEKPSHPELLDHLTIKFQQSGWSLKSLQREILLSATYQLSSAPDSQNNEVDADNRLLWRASRKRLEIEAWRDSVLAVSGKLERTLGGPTVDLGANSNMRRTVYAKVSRHDLHSLLRLFDFPDANITSEKRTETTVPQQQLFVLNSPFIVEQAKALAARLQSEAKDDSGRVQLAYRLAYARSARDTEIDRAVRFLQSSDAVDDKEKAKLTRLERFAQVVLSSNEFMYLD